MSPLAASTVQDQTTGRAASSESGKKSRRRKTSHLKVVPETRELREQLKLRCDQVAGRLDKSRPLSKDEMETVARQLLEEDGLPRATSAGRWSC